MGYGVKYILALGGLGENAKIKVLALSLTQQIVLYPYAA